MANLVRSRSWGDIKPALGSQIDHGHPLADGLRNCFLLNEGGGLIAIDAADTAARIAVGTSTPAWGRGGLHFNGTVTGSTPEQISANAHVDTSFPRGQTIEGLIRIAGSTHGACFQLENNDVATNGVVVKGVVLGVGNGTMDSTGTELIGLNENVAWQASGASIPTNQWAHIALVWNVSGTNSVIYLNGKVVKSNDWGALNGNSGATARIDFMVGGYYTSNGPTNRVFTGDIATARHWDRALTPTEIAWLATEPYAFLQPPGPKSLYIAFPPAADLAIPLLRPIPQYAVHRM